MTIAELIKEVMDSSKERVKSPILGSYICSFLLFNWRPILLLIFSKESIEYNIIVINTWYCNPWTWIVPLIMVGIYTFGMPWVMVWINEKLKTVKEKRIEHIYDSKIFTSSQKMKLAEKEFILKNIESGNKDREELLEQIESLKTTHEQLRQTDKNHIESLNLKLKESNDLAESLSRENQKLTSVDNAKKDNDPILNCFNDLTLSQRNEIITYKRTKNPWDFNNFSSELRRKLIKHLMVTRKNDTQPWKLSKLGENFLQIIDLF